MGKKISIIYLPLVMCDVLWPVIKLVKFDSFITITEAFPFPG